MTVFAHLCAYLRKQFTLPVADIVIHHRLHQDLGLSAIELTEVIVYLELLYEVNLPDEQLSLSLTAGQLCALISQWADKERSALTFLLYPVPTLNRVVQGTDGLILPDKRGV